MAAFNCFRFLRSICIPTTVVITFSFLLTFIFILYQPLKGPGALQKLGWQSWDVITLSEGDSQVGIPPASGPGTSHDGVDWWNATQPGDDSIDYASLPLDVWAPLLPHDTGLSEIHLSRCILDPALVDFCGPPTTVEKDAIRGQWVRVERNLNMQSGIWYLNLYYRRTRRQDVNLITDLKILPEGVKPTSEASSEVWIRLNRSVKDGQPRTAPFFLWYKLGKTWSEMTPDERQNDLITELDVLFGADQPWYGFTRLEPPVTTEREGRLEEVSITYRRGVRVPPRAPPLHFSHDGKFRILQVADLHYSVSRGKCRDTRLDPCIHSDNLTNTLLGRVLDDQKPSMVIFTGDQLNGQGTSWDPKSVLAKFAKAVTERGIPWAAVFGNHDDEEGAGREEQLKMMQGLPYSLVERGPRDIHGVGNYVLKVRSADSSKTHLLTLYFIDSGAYSKGMWDFFGFFHPTDYDYIHANQMQWFLQESASIAQIERPFRPDTSDNWQRQSDDQIRPNHKRLAKPNAMMFFHIPLQESYAKADRDPRTNQPLDIGLRGLEERGSSKENKGFFSNGLLEANESTHVAAKKIPEVKVVGNGHCHITENCRRVQGIWLCFGGGGSYSGYGKIGFDRRFRIYDISDYGETIKTYKYTEYDHIIDEMVLAGAAAPPL